MKLRDHFRLLVYALVVSLVACVPVGYFAGREMLKRRIASWRRDGLAAAQAGDNERAAEILGHYLTRRPGDAAAVRAYVTARESAELPHGHHLAEAANAIRLLLAEDPENIDDRRHLLD